MPLKWRGLQYYVGKVLFGSSGSYTQMAPDGRQTMVGASKVYKQIWIPATRWYGIAPEQFVNPFNVTTTTAGSTPVVSPWVADFGKAAASPVNVPAMAASAGTNTDSRMATTLLAPLDAATTGSVEAKLYFTTRLAMATTGSMQVYRLRYCYLGAAGSPELGVTGSLLYGGSMATTGSGTLEVWDLGDMASFSSTSPLVLIELALEQSNASCMAGSAEDDIIGLKLTYVSDNLGSQVT